MRALAKYSMSGRTQAVTVATVSAALPLMFWISAAVVALVVMRRGPAEGVSLLLWASLPAMIWVLVPGDPTALVVIAGTGVLALVLRASVSWVYTLLAGVLIGVLLAELMPLLLPELIAEMIKVSKQVLAEMVAELGKEAGQQLEAYLPPLFAGILSSIHLYAMQGCLILARWWQASLYNPGGFREEFHRLMLPKLVALPLLLLMLFGGRLHPQLLGWLPVIGVPFVVAGIALVHGLVGLKKLTVHWLFAFYMLLVLFGPYLFMLLIGMAFMDSLLDFRQRVRNSL